MARFLTGVSIGVAATVGCYAFAATSATLIAATFATDQGAHRARMEEFAAAIAPLAAAARAPRASSRSHSQ